MDCRGSSGRRKEPHGRTRDGDRRQQHHPAKRGDLPAPGRLPGDPRRERLRRAREDRRPPARPHLRRHHDAAPRRLPDVRAHQEEQQAPRDAGDHALLQGQPLRPRPGPHGRVRRVPHEALHEGKPAAGGRVAPRPAQPGLERPTTLSATRHSGAAMAIKKIMVVDDSPTERAFMEGLLKKRGYEVLLVDSGEIAIERAKSEQPDLILMDVVMPGLNGFQATRAITREEKTKHIPVIICTTKDQETDKIWGLRQGAKDYVTKPLSESELLEKIKALG